MSKHRLVKFIKRNSIEQQTQTEYDSEVQSYEAKNPSTENNTDTTQEENLSTEDYTDESQCDETTENLVLDENSADPEPCHSQNLHQKRERKPPKYLEDYITDVDNTDVSHVSIDHCYKAVHGIPQSYSDALRSPEGPGWERAMKEGLDSLKENDTFELTSLPKGKNTVGGKWVYAV